MSRTSASMTAHAARTGAHSAMPMDQDVNTAISVHVRMTLVGWMQPISSLINGRQRTAIAPITLHTGAGGLTKLVGS